jgi:hypothetical protein
MGMSVRDELASFRRGARALAVASMSRNALLVALPCVLWWLLARVQQHLPAQLVRSCRVPGPHAVTTSGGGVEGDGRDRPPHAACATVSTAVDGFDAYVSAPDD